ncbi:MAG: polyprenyl synthetase family protein [Pseudomonadota bacterium]
METELSAAVTWPDDAVAPALREAMRYAVLGGGKRFRPFLVQESATLFGLEAEAVRPMAVAVELIHCYSLVHDDLPAMDDDDLRRGRPTVHKAFDEATAILAGDALQTLAFELTMDPAYGAPAWRALPAQVRLKLGFELARASGWAGMGGGQMLDLEAESGDPQYHEEAAIKRIQSLKTGALITFCCLVGPWARQADNDALARMRVYSEALGLAFQISDDLLDVEGDPDVVGKATQKDAEAGKSSFTTLLGVDGAKAKLGALEAEATAALAPYGKRAEILLEGFAFLQARSS